ncbi:hypothetical protein O9992_19070 [Vibrio lentus]|nr:hypothetical protein [Vibrio lentus]
MWFADLRRVALSSAIWPAIYAAAFSGFYLAMILVLATAGWNRLAWITAQG